MAETPFTIQYQKSVQPVSKKRKLDALNVKEEAGLEADDPRVAYSVLPGKKWDSMQKYKNFVVSDKTFGLHQDVYIYHGDEPLHEEKTTTDAPEEAWVARVLEIRAANSLEVYLRVYWMYWPDELPQGRQAYHGQHELIASTHMEIVDAMTVSGRADVTRLVEDDMDAPVAEGLYWRQKYDHRTGKLSPLKRGCVCKQYHNPDKHLIQCTSPACSQWQHEGCLLEAALKRHWERETVESEPAANVVLDEDGLPDTIVTGRVSTTETVGVTATGTSASANTPQRRGRRRRKSRATDDGAKPWEGKLDAKLEFKKGEDGEDTAETTGKALITTSKGGEAVETKETLECLFCHAPLL